MAHHRSQNRDRRSQTWCRRYCGESGALKLEKADAGDSFEDCRPPWWFGSWRLPAQWWNVEERVGSNGKGERVRATVEWVGLCLRCERCERIRRRASGVLSVTRAR